jgi:REP element-mobilizing transposase RayT
MSLVRGSITTRQGAYLPHWTLGGATYAVCFRLGDSLPRSATERWRRERTAILAGAGPFLTSEQESRLRELFAERVERCLDSGHGACWLRRPDIARIAADALQHFDRDRYGLLAWCVMPNHVHAVVQPSARHTLPGILKSWKGFIGKEASRMLGLQGEFWQPEYYDHLIRDADDLAHAIRYVEENPTKAGLPAWPWVSGRGRSEAPQAGAGGTLDCKFTGRETRAT